MLFFKRTIGCATIDDSAQDVRRTKKYLQGKERSGREKLCFCWRCSACEDVEVVPRASFKNSAQQGEQKQIYGTSYYNVKGGGGLDEKCLSRVIVSLLIVWSWGHGGTIIAEKA